MPLNKALAQIGVAKQTVKGTAIANPTFGHGISDGGVLNVSISQDRADITSGVRVAPHADRTEFQAGVDFTGPAFIKSCGLWLLAAIGGDVVTGAGPYTHTITPANVLSYLTAWGWLDGNYARVRDLLVDEVELSWQGDEPVQMKVTGMGTVLDWPGTFTVVTDDTKSAYFVPAGGTFKVDAGSGTAVVAKITGGSIKISNGVSVIRLSGSIVPDDVALGRQDYEVGLTLVPADLTDWRKTVTGTGAGTTVQETPVYGALDVTFKSNVGTETLQITAPRVPFLADFPSSDPAGGPVEVELSGTPVLPTGAGSAITAVLINSQATY